jgi:hypothetical protein
MYGFEQFFSMLHQSSGWEAFSTFDLNAIAVANERLSGCVSKMRIPGPDNVDLRYNPGTMAISLLLQGATFMRKV